MDNLILTGLPWTIALFGVVLGFWYGRRTRKPGPIARRDEITGLPDKRSLLAALRAQLALQRRYHTNFSACLFQADFKDATKHPNAMDQDERWQNLASNLEACSRETEFVGRYSDQQFAVILPHTSLEGAIVYAERVRNALISALPVNVAAGVTLGLDGDTIESFMMRLEEALFLAAVAGKQIFQHTGLEVRPTDNVALSGSQEPATAVELQVEVPSGNHQGADSATVNLAIWRETNERGAAGQAPIHAR